MGVRRDRKSAIQLVTTVGHFLKNGANTYFKTNLVKGRESWSVSSPTYQALSRTAVWGGVVGRQGWGVEEAVTFPDSCSLERWLDVKPACTDRHGILCISYGIWSRGDPHSMFNDCLTQLILFLGFVLYCYYYNYPFLTQHCAIELSWALCFIPAMHSMTTTGTKPLKCDECN